MNAEYIQNLRYKLQKRVRRLRASDHKVYHYALKQFWGFLQSQPVLAGGVEYLKQRRPDAEESADRILSGQAGVFDDEEEHAAASCFVVEKCAASDKPDREVRTGMLYSTSTNYNEMLESFNSQFLDPFYEYLDEQIDDRGAILSLLRRYKHKCEWFQRAHLLQLWEQDTRRGEKGLALHLYEYLQDQGLDFTIEPWSISGEADLVAAQKSDDPLIADVKVLTADRGTGYIAAGFAQVYRYTCDFNEPFGYLIVFNTSAKDLRFMLADQSQNTPFVIHNNKTVFLVTIDISHYDEPASKRGPLQVVEITEADLLRVVEAT
jgi:hypothetical protein